jgi:alpha-mannosidase
MTTEAGILQSLGLTTDQQTAILNGDAKLLILDASAHMDWDWLLPYPVLLMGGQSQRAQWYFKSGVGPVVEILGNAENLLQSAAYRYSICETGFLRGFALAEPAEFAAIAADANTVKIAGGGITSPDNLLPHGEAFIRNYLVGHVWLRANCPNLPVPLTVWIPDDFGHDPELPVLARAMGMIAAGFERIPGGGFGGDPKEPIDAAIQSLGDELRADKIDFTWTAGDGSSIVAHWLIGGYGQGNDILDSSSIEGYLSTNFNPSPTPYIYVPVLSDFSLPNPAITTAAASWNSGGGSYGGTTVIAATGSFEDYAQLVAFHASQLGAPYGAEFNANPFFTGCYGSRPELKIRHQRAARNLVAAEVFSVIAAFANPTGGTSASGTGASAAENLFEGWNLLSPSTHHDYITGTAIPDVFHSEQTTLLRQADATAAWLVQDAMETIAGAIQPSWSQQGTAFAVFNPLGFARTDVVELSAEQVEDVNFSVSGAGFQSPADGGLLFIASAPSLGYQTAYLSSASAPTNPAEVTQETSTVTLSNGLVTAVLQPNGSGVWGLVAVVDVPSDVELIADGEVANDLQFWADGGDEYEFGNEVVPNGWQLIDVTSSLSAPTIAVIESGPVRITVRTTVTYTDANGSIDFIRDYILVADEPMLRFRSTGAAPMSSAPNGYQGCAVIAAFPLTGPIDKLTRGTPYHWTDVMPEVYWNDQTFFATHNFVIPQSGTTDLCAIYHSDIPGWGISNQWNGKSFDPNNGVLYGNLWRNGDAHYYGWVDGYPTLTRGSDPDVHVREYALRMPSSLGLPATGQPLREALAFASPLRAVAVAPWTGALPDKLSLASTREDAALITVAKPGTVTSGDVVFRVYQPTNAPMQVQIIVDGHLNASSNPPPLAVRGQTALEQNLSAADEGSLTLSTTATQITFTATYALTTLAVTPAS